MLARDKAYQDLATVAVLIVLSDGSTLAGNMEKPRTRSLTEFLNYPLAFFEIERKDGSRVQIAKSGVRSVEVTDNPRVDQLATEVKKWDSLEPYQVLGVQKSATKDELRDAYLRLQRLYHPDRYIGTDLPTEVAEYIGGMARRINIAYSMLAERGRPAN
ncbi:MAG: J domain-containing protein [Hyphomicrobiaceae bacterium]|nr:MAG: J domain-containing protein [Hyphomicrobiaceae bacterium]